MKDQKWTELNWHEWKMTLSTIHLFAQIIGKVRLCLMPPEPQWQQVPFTVSSRGLLSSGMPAGSGLLDISFDFISHTICFSTSGGKTVSFSLKDISVAEFYAETMRTLNFLNIKVKINPLSVEMSEQIELDKDTFHKHYDGNYVSNYVRILNSVARIFEEYRSEFWGKQTHVNFFWGSFDLAVVRYSGKPAETPKGADVIYRVAMDAEQIAVGFWPGDETFPEAAFFAYTYPKPGGIEKSNIKPDGAYWSEKKGEFILPYKSLITMPSPENALLDFCRSTYEAGSMLAHWDKTTLERKAPFKKK